MLLFESSVDKVQNVIPPCWEVNMLVKFWKDSLEISMIEISSEDGETVWVCCLLFTDGLVQFTSKIAVNSLGR